MQWLISPSGKGTQAKAFLNELDDKPSKDKGVDRIEYQQVDRIENCIAGVLERLNFPEPPSGQTPKLTFTFRFYL